MSSTLMAAVSRSAKPIQRLCDFPEAKALSSLWKSLDVNSDNSRTSRKRMGDLTVRVIVFSGSGGWWR